MRLYDVVLVLIIAPGSLPFEILAKTPDQETIKELKSPFIRFISDVCILVGIGDD